MLLFLLLTLPFFLLILVFFGSNCALGGLLPLFPSLFEFVVESNQESWLDSFQASSSSSERMASR